MTSGPGIGAILVPGTELPICDEHLNVDIEVLAEKGRAPKIVKKRELIGFCALSDLV